MKNLYVIVLFAISLAMSISAQETQWQYVREIKFKASDTAYVTPFLCQVDSRGRLYVISSKATTTRAHNAIFYADVNDTVMTKLIDYDLNGDSDTLTGNIGALRAIATIKKDVYVISSQPYPKTKPNTVAALYYYPDGDTTRVEKFGFNIQGAGYGTYVNGADMTKDTILLTGIPFNTSIRFYNFSKTITSPARGSWVPITGTYPMEPGGPNTSGMDVIRDVAVIPGGDYTNPETRFFTSRNSYSSTQVTGGIASWVGGDQLHPGSYTGTRITDTPNELAFDKANPYGITADINGNLWVAGTDSTRRWVHGYMINVNRAIKIDRLPSKNASVDPDPLGAPMVTPSDVAFNADATAAYVTDEGNGKVYLFKNMTGVNDEANRVNGFSLNQNYPNPFNPVTVISYILSSPGMVKLAVYDVLGNEVAQLVNTSQIAGSHKIMFDGSKLQSGIYFYTLTTDRGKFTKKMCLIK